MSGQDHQHTGLFGNAEAPFGIFSGINNRVISLHNDPPTPQHGLYPPERPWSPELFRMIPSAPL